MTRPERSPSRSCVARNDCHLPGSVRSAIVCSRHDSSMARAIVCRLTVVSTLSASASASARRPCRTRTWPWLPERPANSPSPPALGCDLQCAIEVPLGVFEPVGINQRPEREKEDSRTRAVLVDELATAERELRQICGFARRCRAVRGAERKAREDQPLSMRLTGQRACVTGDTVECRFRVRGGELGDEREISL